MRSAMFWLLAPLALAAGLSARPAARYTVDHVKQEGAWRLESVREATAVPPNNTEHLEGLAFLIGDWTEDVDKGGSSRASYSWDTNQNFILNTFDVTMKDVSVA